MVGRRAEGHGELQWHASLAGAHAAIRAGGRLPRLPTSSQAQPPNNTPQPHPTPLRSPPTKPHPPAHSPAATHRHQHGVAVAAAQRQRLGRPHGAGRDEVGLDAVVARGALRVQVPGSGG